MADLQALLDREPAKWTQSLEAFLAGRSVELSEEVGSRLGMATPAAVADMMLTSREVSTHYKWLIAADPQHRWKVWLHQYRDDRVAGTAYADVPHNHRYDFVSLLLVGGYRDLRYVQGEEANQLRVGTKYEIGTSQTVAVDHREIHSLTAVLPGTISLFVQGQVRAEYSTSYGPDGPLRHSSLEVVYESLRTALDRGPSQR